MVTTTAVMRATVAVLALVASAASWAQDAAALKAQHARLGAELTNNQFKRPLHLPSTDGAGKISGEVFAVVDQPFAVVSNALHSAKAWCDVMILHLNVKRCKTGPSSVPQRMTIDIGRKFDQPLTDAYRFDFAYKLASRQGDYLNVMLDAAQGPMGTRDYVVQFEAVALDATRSFLHLSYGYRYGAAAGIAMQTYLATAGSSKVGFSVVGQGEDGQPAYIGGTRGAIERNTMRYYVAIQAYLGALALPSAQQFEKRIIDWHDGVERFPKQLRELERGEYLAMKRKEIQRQNLPGD